MLNQIENSEFLPKPLCATGLASASSWSQKTFNALAEPVAPEFLAAPDHSLSSFETKLSGTDNGRSAGRL